MKRPEDQAAPKDAEADERKSCDQGVQELDRAADGTTTSRLLPVPTLVEPFAPSIPEVEPGNKHPPRVALASTAGLQQQNVTHHPFLRGLYYTGRYIILKGADVVSIIRWV